MAAAIDWWENTKSGAFASRLGDDFWSREGHGLGLNLELHPQLLLESFFPFPVVMSPFPYRTLSLMNHVHLNLWFRVCFWVTWPKTLYWPIILKEGKKEGEERGGEREKRRQDRRGKYFLHRKTAVGQWEESLIRHQQPCFPIPVLPLCSSLTLVMLLP